MSILAAAAAALSTPLHNSACFLSAFVAAAMLCVIWTSLRPSRTPCRPWQQQQLPASPLFITAHAVLVCNCCRGDAVRHLDVFATFQNAMSTLAAAAGGEQGLMLLLQAGAGNSPSPAMQVCVSETGTNGSFWADNADVL
jgi:hypothetical protein